METKPLTGVRKRQQIDSANKQMMLWVGLAAAIVTVCAMLSMNLYQHIMYQAKVIGKKSETDKVLKDNIKSIPKLTANVNALQTNAGLLALRADSKDTAFNVVLDALPTVDDRTALGSSIQDKMLTSSGVYLEEFDPSYSISSAVAVGNTTAASPARPTPQSIVFSFTVTGNYESIASALVGIEKTIRPIIIQSITTQGSDNELRATISAITYYVPTVDYSLGSEKVIPDGATDTTKTGTATEGAK